MEQFFYYAQIKSQGVKTQGVRQVSTTVPVDQVPDLMRALGFYPSEQDIDDILNEVKFSDYIETGAYVTEIDLPTFIRLYVNHRPAFGLSPLNLIQAFHALTTNEEGEGPGSSVDRATLLTMLQEHGEHMTESELVEGLMTLLGHCQDPERDGAFDQDPATAIQQGLPESVSAAHFAEKILHLTLQAPPQQPS
jgi:Ca2+-binding EF-hand superfamily protein